MKSLFAGGGLDLEYFRISKETKNSCFAVIKHIFSIFNVWDGAKLVSFARKMPIPNFADCTLPTSISASVLDLKTDPLTQ